MVDVKMDDSDVRMAIECNENKNWICEMCLSEKSSELPMLRTTTLLKFLEERITPTPFLYDYLMKLGKKKKVFTICSNCDAWTRRQMTPIKMKRCGGKTGFLMLDQLILSIMLPGQYQPPEMRITQRLVNIIRKDNGNNCLATVCPPLVVRALCDNDIVMASRQVLKSISVATWRSGRRQVVFGNGIFAKFIRCVGPDN